jgi:hypothetical protein
MVVVLVQVMVVVMMMMMVVKTVVSQSELKPFVLLRLEQSVFRIVSVR